MRQPGRLSSVVLAGTAVLIAACGGDDGPTGPDRGDLEIRVVSGDGQFALAGQALPEPLRVQVRDRVDLDPESGIPVVWSITQGSGAVLSQTSTLTDAQGMAQVSFTLGADQGDYRVRASFEGLTGSPATFQARAVATPTITDLPDAPVQAGQVITVGGLDFSPSPTENLVLFSGIRGAVESASETELQVRVPSCLPTRTVQVTAGFGEVQSQGLPLDVEASGGALSLSVGEVMTQTVLEGLSCLKLEAGTRWAAMVQSASPTDGPTFRYELTGLLGGGSGPSARSEPGSAHLRSVSDGAAVPASPGEAQVTWEGVVRGLERGLAPIRGKERREPETALAAADVPQVGDRRDFDVLNDEREFDRVTAEVVFVGDHAVMYQDLDAPANGLTSGDFQAMAGDFDDVIYPEVTGVFGGVSDLDANQRVVILFTPVVNSLTERGSEGFVGGFFFGLDLLPDREGSNAGEIFYMLVADPGGEFSDRRSRDVVVRVVPEVLAHEFQHMVNFNQRALIRNGSFADALWVSEGMALMAQDVVGEAFLEAGDSAKADLYQVGNWARAQRYLRAPADWSLVGTQGQGELAERGSWWLFFRYLRGLRGNNGVLTELTQTVRTGVSNVEAVTGSQWPALVGDWGAAIVLDDQDVPVPDRLRFQDLALRETIDRLQDGWPLSPAVVGGTDFRRTGELVASATAYYELRPSTLGGTSQVMGLNLAGPNGGSPAEGAGFQLVLVRIQ